jgi:hypothetical protein
LAPLAAAGFTLLGFAVIFGWWLVMFAAWPFAAVALRVARLRAK